MKFTNKYGLPRVLVKALTFDEYSLDADYSATGLVKPPQVAVLERRYDEDIVVDVSDLIWILQGKAVHRVLEKTPGFSLVRERTIFIEIGGVRIQCTPDLYDMEHNDLWDYKITSVYAVQSVKPEWEAQGNIYRFALEREGSKVHRIKVMGILRDWSKKKYELDKLRGFNSYPPIPFKELTVNRWATEETFDFLEKRVQLHENAKNATDKELAKWFACSPIERWARPSTYPIIRKGRAVRGTAKFETPAEAEAWLEKNGKAGETYTERPGEQVRCEGYCNAAPFCHQFKQLQQAA